MINPDKTLFIPSMKKGNGTGHFQRCLELARQINGSNFYSWGLKNDHRDLQWKTIDAEQWELVILDNRQTEKLEENLLKAPILALDESGKIRKTASYVLDILPGHNRKGSNKEGVSFLYKSPLKRERKSIQKILISFGGEDPSQLSNIIKTVFQNSLKQYICHILNPSLQEEWRDKNHEYKKSIPDLKGKIHEYDLVICSFGLTAFEALSARVPVLLMNPTYYHDRLSKRCKLPYIPGAWKGLHKNGLTKIDTILQMISEDRVHIWDNLWKQYNSESENLAQWIQNMNISRNTCPACASTKRKAIIRFSDKSYFSCQNCSIIYMVQFRMKEDIYNEDYFFTDYEKQYGKTYIDDFPHIQAMAQSRLSRMKLSSASNILDIGCAYGPFLLSALESGHKAYGLEISEHAVRYIKDNFPQIEVHQGNIEKMDSIDVLKNDKFDAITMWYVIEHIQQLDKVLPMVYGKLNNNGVLAFSTPYASGISRRFHMKNFFQESPEDHFTLWTKKSARKVLSRTGFKNIKFYNTGHHPERFPGIFKILPKSIRLFMSYLFEWGDTFEIYAKKGK